MTDRVDNYLRLQYLLTESYQVLRKFFDMKCRNDDRPYIDLSSYLSSRKEDIKILVTSEIINQRQYDLLCASGTTVTLDDLDITLLIALLLTLFEKLSDTERIWIENIRDKRSELSLYGDITAVTKTAFLKYWEILEGATIPLASKIDATYAADVSKSMNNLRAKDLTPSTEFLLEVINDISAANKHKIVQPSRRLQTLRTEMSRTAKPNEKKSVPSQDKHGDSVLRNLIGQTRIFTSLYRTYKRAPEYDNAKAILQDNRLLRINGARSSGKTVLATQLMYNYPEDKCVILRNSTDVKHLDFGDLSIVMIDDVGGKYASERQQVLGWYKEFDFLLQAVRAKVLSVIVITNSTYFDACRLPTHDLLSKSTTLTLKKSDNKWKGNQQEQSAQVQQSKQITADKETSLNTSSNKTIYQKAISQKNLGVSSCTTANVSRKRNVQIEEYQATKPAKTVRTRSQTKVEALEIPTIKTEPFDLDQYGDSTLGLSPFEAARKIRSQKDLAPSCQQVAAPTRKRKAAKPTQTATRSQKQIETAASEIPTIEREPIFSDQSRDEIDLALSISESVIEYVKMKALLSKNNLEAYRWLCSALKKSCSEIVDVAATKSKKDEYDFVVITPNPVQTRRNIQAIFPKLRDYPVTYRDVVNEGKLVQDKITEELTRRGHEFSYEIGSNVRDALVKYGEDLMDQHKNLNAVHFSPFKSEGFLAGQQVLVEGQYIVLYVNVKFPNRGVPIGEEEFPKELDGVPVDIRESYIVPLTHIGQDIECKTVRKTSTLGPLVKFPDDSVGFFTSMHGVIPPAELLSINRTEGINIVRPSILNEISDNDMTGIGFVQEYHYRKGTIGTEPGFEVGLVKFYPGKQPRDAILAKDNGNGYLHFNRAQYFPAIPENYKYTQVFKFGAVSGWTRGVFDTLGPNVNRLKCTCTLEDVGIKICDQIAILGIEGYPFAKQGDSGAIVVLPYSGDTNDLRAVGIVTGGMKTGQYLISPIAPILESFPGFELKRYTSEPMIID